MNNNCEKIQNQMVDYVLGFLEQKRVPCLIEHINECESCRKYLQSIETENKLLIKTGKDHEVNITQGKKRAIKALGNLNTKNFKANVSVFRLGMKNAITKFAAAALLMISIVVLGFILLDKTVSSTYAVEQTIKKLQDVTTVHVIGTNWDGNRFEAWNKIDPLSGEAVWCCIDETPYGYKIASRLDGSCVWDQDGNIVRYSNNPIASNDFRFSHVFEQIAEMMIELNNNEKITIQTEKDPVYDEPLVVIHVITSIQDYRIYVDPRNKLPVRMYFDRADNMVQIAKTFDEIYYNVPLPEGMFDFEVPEEWYRDWSLLDDPAKGLAIGDLSHEQGAIKTAREYWQAVIEGNWDYADQLRPVADWKTDYHRDRPADLIDIGQPYPERVCSGLVTPCIVRFADGKMQKIELVINYRQIAGVNSCIIVATWGWPVILSD